MDCSCAISRSVGRNPPAAAECLAHASLAAFTRAFNAIGNLIAPGDGFVVKQVQTGYPSQEDDEQAPVLALPYRRMWAVEQKAKEVQVGLCNMQ